MKVVTVTAGHSNTDPGAVNGKRTEAEIVAEMRNMVVSYLKTAGIVTRCDGTGTTNLPLTTAIQLAKGSTLAVEFHCNASTDRSARGVEVLSGDKHKAIAQRIAGAVNKVLGIPLRGDKGWKSEGSGQHSRLGFISKADGLIVELFFISNNAELALWDAKKWLVAKEVAGVIVDYINGLD
ncbi:N-acetylmuramoyl-L-alanine amidase [Acinetobacter baumannii]|uniref:N-acetylmuramoyl-L-alanine amidase n=1 Tax=Acinetobacter baumannii TaxID=470 RepID=UPI00338E14F5|nr:N-acetylmuramoyl-L-alanine amidase [Acinetobacter baumannii]